MIIKQEKLKGDKDGLIVANSLAVAKHIAKRVKTSLGDVQILEVCSGIGATTIALAKEFSSISAVEIDAMRVKYAKQNLGKLSKNVKFYNNNIFSQNLLSELQNKQIQTVVTDVEWTTSGAYGKDWAINIEDTNPNTKKLYNLLAKTFTKNLIMRLPNTIDREEIRSLGDCEIEEIIKEKNRVSFLVVYFGDLKNSEKSKFFVNQNKP